jgi:hypothetical protein
MPDNNYTQEIVYRYLFDRQTLQSELLDNGLIRGESVTHASSTVQVSNSWYMGPQGPGIFAL